MVVPEEAERVGARFSSVIRSPSSAAGANIKAGEGITKVAYNSLI